MTIWPGLAIIVLVLAAGGVAWALAITRALARFEPDDAEHRRRARRRERAAMGTFLVTVPVTAALWLLGSPSDAWWVLPLAIALIAAIVVAFRLQARRSRAADAASTPRA